MNLVLIAKICSPCLASAIFCSFPSRDKAAMIHYSCDRCKRPIEGRDAVRYVVKMEIEATIDCDDCSPDIDQDALLEMDAMLENLEDEVLDYDCTPLFECKRYDLCPDCYREFVKNPLAREKFVPFGFSQN
jgi:DNA-directed RNA polymerase subunit RPC12/RpoP